MIVNEGRGDIFHCESQTLTCPVNTVGVMGAGLAKEFRLRLPGLFEYYVREYPAPKGPLDTEAVYRLRTYPIGGGQQVLLFPTKQHWSGASRFEWVEANLRAIARDYRKLGIHSLALPAVGCGLGGLDWYRDVRPLAIQVFGGIDLPVELLSP